MDLSHHDGSSTTESDVPNDAVRKSGILSSTDPYKHSTDPPPGHFVVGPGEPVQDSNNGKGTIVVRQLVWLSTPTFGFLLTFFQSLWEKLLNARIQLQRAVRVMTMQSSVCLFLSFFSHEQLLIIVSQSLQSTSPPDELLQRRQEMLSQTDLLSAECLKLHKVRPCDQLDMIVPDSLLDRRRKE